MKLNAKTLTISLTPELSNRIYNYLQTENNNETKAMQKILNQGLSIEDGTYADQRTDMIEEQLKALNRNHDTSNVRLKLIENQLADIDDHIINQDSDESILIDKDPNKN